MSSDWNTGWIQALRNEHELLFDHDSRSLKPEFAAAIVRSVCDSARRFAEHPLYIVTEGTKTVQDRKVAALGLKNTVRVMRGTHAEVRSSPSHEAQVQIRDLDELTERVLADHLGSR